MPDNRGLDVATSGQGYLSLALAQSLGNCHRNALTTCTFGPHNSSVHPGTVRNLLREAGIRTHCPRVGPPLTHTRRMRRMMWLTAYTTEDF